MPDILVRNVKPEAVDRLKARAKQHGRSLQGEVKALLEQAAGLGGEEVSRMLDGWKQRFAGRTFSRSTDLIHEDRQR